jgi:hypothetical protein
MGLNGLLGFKGPTHLMPTQTHPFDTPNIYSRSSSFLFENRFEQFQIYENIFGFLFDLNKLTSPDHDNLEKYYVNLESFLKHDNFLILMILLFFFFQN